MNNRAIFDYSGAHVLVTGGTSGIGHGIASAFAEAGARVTVTGTRGTAADYPGVNLEAFEFQSLDVRDTAALKAFAAGLEQLDILINNAGASMPAGDEWSHEGFEASVQLNLLSAFHLSRACLDHLTASKMRGGASVLGIASLTSFFANEMVPGYGAAKAGIAQMAKSMGLTWADRGIRANAIAAGMTESRMTRPVKDMPEMDRAVIERTPLGRWGQPEDMAGAALYLCSEQAGFITGQTLVVDGGYTLAV
ncbi:SDR family NAD(P)-dependent oxidoreductase [Parahaliea mediterranea]|uniref:SDR family oxidoreductase n=1 Tax=Parahaliea mediterranea TaxID=651086 RepID=A0A939IJG0_9GAMM|nr:SDR family oxidoreductase [Parahaliea mediterranea]MBN7797624.1 SDR family oxidoreductase [Parahaliea mediterranea]